MTQTKAGALKARQTIIDNYGTDFWKNAGSVGGKVKSPLKGFGSNKEMARIAGAKGGRVSRRKAAK